MNAKGKGLMFELFIFEGLISGEHCTTYLTYIILKQHFHKGIIILILEMQKH